MNGHDTLAEKPSAEQVVKRSLEAMQAQVQQYYKTTLHWMASTKIKHDALELACALREEGRQPTGAELAQIKAARNLKLRVEGEEQWLARTIMLTEVLETYLRLKETDGVDPDELQRAYNAVKDRHFVFMPAQADEVVAAND